MSSLASLPESDRLGILAKLSDDQLEEMRWDWRIRGRPDQIPPVGEWLTWLVLAGRGFGKTRSGCEWVRSIACGESPLAAGSHRRIAVVAETAADARDVLVEGESGILAIHPPDFRPLFEPSKRRITWPNGAMATLYNGTEPDQLRGPQHDAALVDELAKYDYAREAWDMLQFGLRLGNNPRQVVTTTPRPIGILKEIVASPNTIITRGTTYDNLENLAESYRNIIARYEGTRLGRQELNAEILDDLPGALWTRDMLDKVRTREGPPDLVRVVVAIDPSGTEGVEDDGDSIGIIVAGLGVDGKGHVLADRTCKLSPASWGRRSVQAYHEFQADRIIAERNFGGAMVRHVIETTDSKVAFEEVTASRGKAVRAEPVAALYEQGRVVHHGLFSELEDQMCQFSSTGYIGDGSPDRVDALVWAITSLMLGETVVEVTELLL